MTNDQSQHREADDPVRAWVTGADLDERQRAGRMAMDLPVRPTGDERRWRMAAELMAAELSRRGWDLQVTATPILSPSGYDIEPDAEGGRILVGDAAAPVLAQHAAHALGAVHAARERAERVPDDACRAEGRRLGDMLLARQGLLSYEPSDPWIAVDAEPLVASLRELDPWTGLDAATPRRAADTRPPDRDPSAVIDPWADPGMTLPDPDPALQAGTGAMIRTAPVTAVSPA